MIGASRPKVSIAMNRFIREGMVLREHRQLVLIVQKLNAFVASPALAEPARVLDAREATHSSIFRIA